MGIWCFCTAEEKKWHECVGCIVHMHGMKISIRFHWFWPQHWCKLTVCSLSNNVTAEHMLTWLLHCSSVVMYTLLQSGLKQIPNPIATFIFLDFNTKCISIWNSAQILIADGVTYDLNIYYKLKNRIWFHYM